MFDEDVTVWAPMPRWLLLPCSLDKVQGRQTRPPLVPKNFSRLLPHKVTMGSLSQDEKCLKKSVIPDLAGWEGALKMNVFQVGALGAHTLGDKVTWGEELRQAQVPPMLLKTATRLLRWLYAKKTSKSSNCLITNKHYQRFRSPYVVCLPPGKGELLVHLTSKKPQVGSPRAGNSHSHCNQCQGFFFFFLLFFCIALS